MIFFNFSENTLNTFKTDLRNKYINELDAIQRSAASDPEAWKDFENSVKRTQELQELVNSVDDLVLLENSEQNENLNVNDSNLNDEISCPVCFEDMVSPKSVLVCSNGHPICSDCERKIKSCPVCRECYAHDGKPKRAKFAERLIAMYVESLKKE